MPNKPQQKRVKKDRPLNPSKASTNPERTLPKGTKVGPGGMRDRGTIRRLNMYRERPIRNKKGEIIGGTLMSRVAPKHARIAPDRRYFGKVDSSSALRSLN